MTQKPNFIKKCDEIKESYRHYRSDILNFPIFQSTFEINNPKNKKFT